MANHVLCNVKINETELKSDTRVEQSLHLTLKVFMSVLPIILVFFVSKLPPVLLP